MFSQHEFSYYLKETEEIRIWLLISLCEGGIKDVAYGCTGS